MIPSFMLSFAVEREEILSTQRKFYPRAESGGILWGASLKRGLRQKSRSGGIGRRARLKIVFPTGMRVRFPPSALYPYEHFVTKRPPQLEDFCF